MRASKGPRRTVQTGRGNALRPPWTDETRVRQACTSCGACVAACPEAILIPGPANTPAVNFTAGACTFCGACADACPEDVFRDRAEKPWPLVAQIQANCLLSAGIACRSCTDACAQDALRFAPQVGSAGRIDVYAAACTGCGACLGVCPVGAIGIDTATEARPEVVA